MVTKNSELAPLNCLPGVQPSTDKTRFATKHWTFSDKIRFINGYPQKIGGWVIVNFQNGAQALGAARRIFSTIIDNRVYTLVGTHRKLYNILSGVLTNITPLSTTTNSIQSSLATLYAYNTLSSDPIATTSGSTTITISDTVATRYRISDVVNISGISSAIGGISTSALNGEHIIRSVSTASYTARVSETASSTTTGGGASVVRASGLLNITDNAHGQTEGDRVKITGASAVGGLTTAQINLEFVIRNVSTNEFDVMTSGTATSLVTSAGGAAVYQQEIPSGNRDARLGQGYGMGRYGVGLYGVPKFSSSGISLPRIWFIDHFGETVVATPGNQTGCYQWDGTLAAAPTLIPNAPTAVNYLFVSNNILVTLGADGVPNRIKASDQGDITNWTSSSTNQVFTDDIETAGRFLSHLPVLGQNLIFTNQHTYTFRYIGGLEVWEIKLKDAAVGIIGALAGVSVNNVAYWMGDNNFYMWRGGNVEVIPSNSQPESTIQQYVFRNINFSQKSKCFAWYNERFNEIWFHYPSSGSTDPNRIARVCLTDWVWVPDTMARVAVEYPEILQNNPRLAAINGDYSDIYQHEVGTDDNTSALAFTLTTNLKTGGKGTVSEVGIIPDSSQVGSVTLTANTYQFPQSTSTTYSEEYTITPTTERVTIDVNGRVWDYTISGNELGQSFRMGDWQQYIQAGSPE